MSDQSGYEFTQDENRDLSGLSRGLHHLAMLLFLAGGLQVCVSFYESFKAFADEQPRSQLVVLLVMMLTGYAAILVAHHLSRASADFRSIVDTEGRDIDHLMTAVKRLGRVFFVSRFVALAVVAALLLAVWFGLGDALHGLDGVPIAGV